MTYKYQMHNRGAPDFSAERGSGPLATIQLYKICWSLSPANFWPEFSRIFKMS